MNKQEAIKRASSLFSESMSVKQQTFDTLLPQIVEMANIISDAFSRGNKLMICGNGGSAADAQHMATEFTVRLSKALVRPALPAIALTTDTSFLTACANDFSFDEIFARQVQALGKPGDVLIGLSTSGSSANVVRAIKEAKNLGLTTIGLCGSGGEIVKLADKTLSIQSTDPNRIQESHLVIEHIVCDLVEHALYGVLKV